MVSVSISDSCVTFRLLLHSFLPFVFLPDVGAEGLSIFGLEVTIFGGRTAKHLVLTLPVFLVPMQVKLKYNRKNNRFFDRFFHSTGGPRYMRSFYLQIWCICNCKLTIFLERIRKFTVIIGLFICKFIICESDFSVPIYCIYRGPTVLYFLYFQGCSIFFTERIKSSINP